MGSLNFIMLPLLIAFVVGLVRAESESAEIESSIAVVKTDLERLRSKVSQLELILEDKTSDLNIKRNLVTQKEKEIEDQSQTIISVQNMIEVMQQKESGNTITLLAKAYARIRELETQVEGLKESIRKQKQEQSYFKLQVDKAKKKAKEQASKNEKAYRGWLTPWAGVNLLELQTIAISYWVEHAESVMDILTEKASALYLFPLFGMCMLCSFIFGMSKKIAKPVRSSPTVNTRRKSNRRHAKK